MASFEQEQDAVAVLDASATTASPALSSTSSPGKRKRGADAEDDDGFTGGALPLFTSSSREGEQDEGADVKVVKVPARTMLYMPLVLAENQRVALHDHDAFLHSAVEGRLLYRSAQEARMAAAPEAARIHGSRVRLVELQTLKTLQLLNNVDDVSRADGACCDGVQRQDGAILFEDAADLLRLVDEDKLPCKSQQLISDMFGRLSIQN